MGSSQGLRTTAIAACLLLLPAAARADAQPTPGWQELAVSSLRGSGTLPVLVSGDWSRPEPGIVRVVITLHGEQRDADATDAVAREALARAGSSGRGTLLVTPLFPRGDDTVPRHLRWPGNGWIDGGDAAAPAALGAFDAMDALIGRLTDRSLFPSLATIVLVGHSAGGQFVQRYAEIGHAGASAARAGIALRYVIANPSSYAYFTPDRPTPSGGFAPYPLDQCHRFDRWKYGLERLPPYAGDDTPGQIERDYVRRDVTLLLGTRDTDPDLGALDRSCAAEAQGPSHYERGHAFFRYLQLRHPDGLRQRLHDVAGVGHDTRGMLTSDCALAAIYDAPSCGDVAPAPVPPPPAVAEIHTGAAPSPLPPPPPPPPPHAASHRLAHRPRPLPPRRPEPPAPRRPGFAWQPGGWEWDGTDYVWLPGRAVPAMPVRSAFVPGHWRFDGIGWLWIPAHWR